jgi:hypothetical protein
MKVYGRCRENCNGEAIKEKLLPITLITVSFMKDMIKLKN